MTTSAARAHVLLPLLASLAAFVGIGAPGCGGEASTTSAHPAAAPPAPSAPPETSSARVAPNAPAPSSVTSSSSAPAVDGAAPAAGSGSSAPAARAPAAPTPRASAAVAPPNAKPADGARHPKVVSIGMHVAGGPFDEPTKVPFKRAVEPHYPRLLACLDHVTPPQGGDAGVDLAIDAKGGKPRVTNPRSTIKNEAFVACVVAFFESMEFEPPKNGRTNVSYSVRFTP